MNLDYVDNVVPPSIPPVRAQTSHSGCRSNSHPSASAVGPQHVLPSYPSSTLQNYYPHDVNFSNYAHISTSQQPFSYAPVMTDLVHPPLPSASQSHLPSLRHTPSVPSAEHIHTQRSSASPLINHQNSISSHNSQRIHSLSPTAFPQPQSVPVFAAPQPIPLQPNTILRPNMQLPHTSSHFSRPQFIPHIPITSNSQISYVNPSLPSTKDVPTLTGKLDWGPWHSAVRTLILNANLLGHIADEPLPGALFDPGLWPTYPPVVHQQSTPAELQSFAEWWSRDGLASHILTSRLSSTVLGSIPIANERMGHCRSARTVYITLRHQYGAGDYSAVMVIEARLRQLRCLPSCGGVRVLDFISTWRISINQMEAAGFLPGIRHLLAIFADGLPNNTVAFINLYDNIMSSLNEPYEQSLPNIHHLFDRTIHIENTIQRNRILHPSIRRPPIVSPPTATSNQLPPSLSSSITPTTPNVQTPRSTKSGSTLNCTNCGRDGHTPPASNLVEPWKAVEKNTSQVDCLKLSHTLQRLKRT